MPIPAVERTRESTDLGSGASHGVALTLLGGVVAVLAWSGIGPHDYKTWALEVIPAVIAMVVLGGMGSIVGSLVGAFVLVVLPQALTVFHDYEQALLGLIVMVFMIFLRRGIVPSLAASFAGGRK